MASLGHGPAREQVPAAEKTLVPLGGGGHHAWVTQGPSPGLAPGTEAENQLPMGLHGSSTFNRVKGTSKHFHVSIKSKKDTTGGVSHTHRQKWAKSIFLTIVPFNPFIFPATSNECHPA